MMNAYPITSFPDKAVYQYEASRVQIRPVMVYTC